MRDGVKLYSLEADRLFFGTDDAMFAALPGSVRDKVSGAALLEQPDGSALLRVILLDGRAFEHRLALGERYSVFKRIKLTMPEELRALLCLAV